MTERTDRELLEANRRRCARIVNTWPKWMQDVTLTKHSPCQHCRDDTHYRIEGDGIAVLRPETLRGCPKFRNELDCAAMAEGGEQ